jgi:hypothetical protein
MFENTMTDLFSAIDRYSNTQQGNDEVWSTFTKLTNKSRLLKSHRRYIEWHRLGFGDRAFHYMWKLLLDDLQQQKKEQNRDKVRLLEIGVYKGQIISLWSLLSRESGLEAEIHAITPLEGTAASGPLMTVKLFQWFKKRIDPEFNELCSKGNLYWNEDYHRIISDLFKRFDLDFNDIHLHRGYSTAQEIIDEVKDLTFDAIYIDGDHSYDVVVSDIATYAPLVRPGGYLVMDDASCFLESTRFWKGHKEVSEACKTIEDFGYDNVINVGHNRVFRKR